MSRHMVVTDVMVVAPWYLPYLAESCLTLVGILTYLPYLPVPTKLPYPQALGRADCA